MDLASKLDLKSGMTVSTLDVPTELVLDLGEVTTTASGSGTDATILFAVDESALASSRDHLVEAAKDDRVVWVAYPKGGQLGTDLSRDRLRELLVTSGIRPVRQISIDDTWSALRFRPA